MDFLLMALLYTLFFVALSYIIFAGRSEYHRGGWIGLFRRNVFSVSSESKWSDEYKFSNITWLSLRLRTFAPNSCLIQTFLKLWLLVENDKIRLKKWKNSGVTDLVLKIMHQLIPAVPIPPPRANPRALAFFSKNWANSPVWGHISCLNPPG